MNIEIFKQFYGILKADKKDTRINIPILNEINLRVENNYIPPSSIKV